MSNLVFLILGENELDTINKLKTLISYLPQNCEEIPANLPYELDNEERPSLDTIVPENPNQPYDIKDVIQICLMKIVFLKCNQNMLKIL